VFALYHDCLCRGIRVCGTLVDTRCRVMLRSQIATAWLETKHDNMFARLRLLFDFLQVTGLLMAMGAHEPRWFVVCVALLLCCRMHPYETGIMIVSYIMMHLQSVISGLSGAAIGGGFSASTWAPYLCVLPSSVLSLVWIQFALFIAAFPLAAGLAHLSSRRSAYFWKSTQALFSAY
jgi:hypothetical protein